MIGVLSTGSFALAITFAIQKARYGKRWKLLRQAVVQQELPLLELGDVLDNFEGAEQLSH